MKTSHSQNRSGARRRSHARRHIRRRRGGPGHAAAVRQPVRGAPSRSCATFPRATSSRPICRASNGKSEALGVDLRIFDSRQDAALQADMVDQAIALASTG